MAVFPIVKRFFGHSEGRITRDDETVLRLLKLHELVEAEEPPERTVKNAIERLRDENLLWAVPDRFSTVPTNNTFLEAVMQWVDPEEQPYMQLCVSTILESMEYRESTVLFQYLRGFEKQWLRTTYHWPDFCNPWLVERFTSITVILVIACSAGWPKAAPEEMPKHRVAKWLYCFFHDQRDEYQKLINEP